MPAARSVFSKRHCDDAMCLANFERAAVLFCKRAEQVCLGIQSLAARAQVAWKGVAAAGRTCRRSFRRCAPEGRRI